MNVKISEFYEMSEEELGYHHYYLQIFDGSKESNWYNEYHRKSKYYLFVCMDFKNTIFRIGMVSGVVILNIVFFLPK